MGMWDIGYRHGVHLADLTARRLLPSLLPANQQPCQTSPPYPSTALLATRCGRGARRGLNQGRRPDRASAGNATAPSAPPAPGLIPYGTRATCTMLTLPCSPYPNSNFNPDPETGPNPNHHPRPSPCPSSKPKPRPKPKP
eukprot:scaffold38739_cov53-Phaeocystis_antarctica.AAC.4